MKNEFKEVQKFTQWWLWLILIPIETLLAIGIYKQMILGEKFGNSPLPDFALIILALFIFSLIVLFFIMKLTTTIDKSGIQMRLFPFVSKQVCWEGIKKAEIVTYGFAGGWGIRPYRKYGTVYNTKGRKGLAIELKNGEKFLIGTQKETELKSLLENLRNANNL